MSNNTKMTQEQHNNSQKFLSQKSLPLEQQTMVTDIVNLHLALTAAQIVTMLKEYPMRTFTSRRIIQGVIISAADNEVTIDVHDGQNSEVKVLTFKDDTKVSEIITDSIKDGDQAIINKYDLYRVGLALHELTLGININQTQKESNMNITNPEFKDKPTMDFAIEIAEYAKKTGSEILTVLKPHPNNGWGISLPYSTVILKDMGESVYISIGDDNITILAEETMATVLSREYINDEEKLGVVASTITLALYALFNPLPEVQV